MKLPIQMYDPLRDPHYSEIKETINKVLDHGLFINGPEITTLESLLATYTNVKHCITVANGTDALHIALLALNVGPNDEVITVSHSWISTAEIIPLVGAIPVFVDIDAKTFNLDSSKLESKITSKTKAIIAVSLYGQMADFFAINEIAQKYNIPVIEDAAQSFGATQFNQKSCSVTTIATTSFFPSKPLGCYGDGGACFTNDDKLGYRMRCIKNHGCLVRFEHKIIGMNSRLDTMQAAILLTKMTYLDENLEKRRSCAQYYSDKLLPLQHQNHIKLPIIKKGNVSVWAQYSILTTNKHIRDSLVSYLKEKQINISIFYPIPIHQQSCFQYLNYQPGDLPITENICHRILNLPCYANLYLHEQNYIIDSIFSFFRSL